MTCPHTKYQQIGSDRCFTGSVAASEETTNRAAHGNITYTVECSACGARQDRNCNQNFVEVGRWGPTRAEQLAEARERLRSARAKELPIPEPVTISSKARGVSVRVVCGADGYLTIHGDYKQSDVNSILRALPAAWVEAAKELRLHASWVSSLETAVRGAA